MIEKAVDGTSPAAVVETMWSRGSVHPTGACSMPATRMVG
jgi:hypothetical protein